MDIGYGVCKVLRPRKDWIRVWPFDVPIVYNKGSVDAPKLVLSKRDFTVRYRSHASESRGIIKMDYGESTYKMSYVKLLDNYATPFFSFAPNTSLDDKHSPGSPQYIKKTPSPVRKST
jgi:hypothetical protein